MDPAVSVVNLDDEISLGLEAVEHGEPTPNLLSAGPMAGGDFDTTNLTSGRSSGVCSSPPDGPTSTEAPVECMAAGDQLIRDVINQLERHCSTSEVSMDVGENLQLASSLFAASNTSPSSAAIFEKNSSPIHGESREKQKSPVVYSSGAYSMWIASAKTRETLALVPPSADGRICYTMPGIMVEDSLGDPTADALRKHCSDDPSLLTNRRSQKPITQITIPGLLELLATGDFRAAIDVSGKLLKTFGHGMGKAHQPSRNTEESLKIWSIRFHLLLSIGQYNLASTEMEAFGNLDSPDLYFEYYPETYRGRKGSMVPFSMRLLHAELPRLIGQHQESLVRLNRVLAVIRQIIKNLNSSSDMASDDRDAALTLWRRRQRKALHALARSLMAVKDFQLASTIYDNLMEHEENKIRSVAGRMQLMLGNSSAAKLEFQKYQASGDDAKTKSLASMHAGYMNVFNSNFTEASTDFQKAAHYDPTNVCAVNNAAVCLLYLGRLEDAVQTLESSVHQSPSNALQEGICTNLCTLYELESARSTQKKISMLKLVNQHKGDAFNMTCLKLPV